MATFAEVRLRAFLRACLSKERMAEDVTYFPASGGQRTVRVLIQPVSAEVEDRPAEITRVEQIDVRCAKDPDTELDGELLSGIADPLPGDGLLRSSDEPDRYWSFAFIVFGKENPMSWVLRFQRERIHQLGAGATQR